MRYRIELEGLSALIMHSQRSVDKDLPEVAEIAELSAKRGGNQTSIDRRRIAELECGLSIWTNAEGQPTIPEGAVRSCIETAARKRKEGPLVREGMLVEAVKFHYDTARYGVTLEQLALSTQFKTAVNVQRQKVLRTRARFDAWSATVLLDTDEELIDRFKLEAWLRIGGKRIGLGDWRPEKSGLHGRFIAASIDELGEV